MGKVVLIVFLVLLAIGGYWFYWEDGGANAPITVEYDISSTAWMLLGNRWVTTEVDGDLNVYATADKLKIALHLEFRTQGRKATDFRIEGILRLDEKRLYLILPDEKIYTEDKFDFVPKSQIKKPKGIDIDWFRVFDVKIDGRWFGPKDERYFARKHIPNAKEIEQLKAQMPGLIIELWFTRDIRAGNGYLKGINKLLRIGDVEKEIQKNVKKKGEKRPQLASIDLAYFPLPAKIFFYAKNPITGELRRIDITATQFSRRKIPESVFKVSSEYKKISFTDFMKKLGEKMISAMTEKYMSFFKVPMVPSYYQNKSSGN